MRKLFALIALLPFFVACGGGSDEDGITPDNVPDSCEKYDTALNDPIQIWDVAALDFRVPAPTGCMQQVIDAVPIGSDCILKAAGEDFADERNIAYSLQGSRVRVFPANRVQADNPATANCAPAGTPLSAGQECWEAIADAAWEVTFTGLECRSQVAVWVYKESTGAPLTKPAIEFNRYVIQPAGDTTVDTLVSISVATYNLLPAVAGIDIQGDLGIAGGTVSIPEGADAASCVAEPGYGLQVGIESGALAAPDTPDFCGKTAIYRTSTFYFANELPSKNQHVTDEDGLWAFANIPPGDVTVFAGGVWTAGDTYNRDLGRATMQVFPDTISIGDIVLDLP